MRYIIRTIIPVLLVIIHFGCKEQDVVYNSDHLLGEWQLHSTISSDGDEWTEDYKDDPVMRIKFYGTDSVKYFNLFGTYTSNEELGEILFHITDKDLDRTHRHEVTKLDSSEMWLKEITNTTQPFEMRFKKR